MQDEEKTAPFPNPNVALGASKTGWDALDKCELKPCKRLQLGSDQQGGL